MRRCTQQHIQKYTPILAIAKLKPVAEAGFPGTAIAPNYNWVTNESLCDYIKNVPKSDSVYKKSYWSQKS